MFSLIIKHPNPVKHTDANPLKKLEEPFLKNKMIDTYIANDKYYRLTA
jgi:hypothetical protein